MTDLADVFLSYARENGSRVELLEHALQALGIRTWRDVSELTARDRFADRIEQELSTSKAVLVCWSSAAASKRWVKEEATVAERNGTYVGCLIAPGGPSLGFTTLQYFDLTDWDGAPDDPRLLRLLQPIGELMQRAAATADERTKAKKIASLLRAHELAQEEKEEAKRRRAAAERVQLEAARRKEEIAQERVRQRQQKEQERLRHEQESHRERESRRWRSFQQVATPLLSRYYWWNPAVAALVLFPYGILLFYLFAWLLHGLIVGTQKTFSRLAAAIVLLWALALVPTFMAVAAHMSRGPL